MDKLIEHLLKSEIFRELEQGDLEALFAKMEPQSFAANTILFHKGDEGDKMYEIVSGSIRIYTDDKHGNELTIVIRKEGEIVGEMALLDKQPRSASAMAAEALDVLVLERESFLEFLQERPAVGMKMIHTLIKRLRYTTDYLQKVMEWINRLSKGDYDAAVAELMQEQEEGEIAQLIGAFLQMVDSVKKRETNLQRELDELQTEN